MTFRRNIHIHLQGRKIIQARKQVCYLLHVGFLIGLAICSSEMSVDFQRTPWVISRKIEFVSNKNFTLTRPCCTEPCRVTGRVRLQKPSRIVGVILRPSWLFVTWIGSYKFVGRMTDFEKRSGRVSWHVTSLRYEISRFVAKSRMLPLCCLTVLTVVRFRKHLPWNVFEFS
jgi:hypothetical protein